MFVKVIILSPSVMGCRFHQAKYGENNALLNVFKEKYFSACSNYIL